MEGKQMWEYGDAAMLIADASLRICHCNPSALRLLGGANGDSLNGRRLHEFLSSVTSGACLLLRDETPLVVSYGQGPDGMFYVTLMPTKTTASDLLEENKRLSALVDSLVEVTVADITRRKDLESRLRLERDRSEALLLSVLPLAVIPRLHGRLDSLGDDPIADFFPEGSVLFSDIVGFTTMASRISAVDVIRMLNKLFNMFDELAEKFAVTKIKTIGDAYMVVSGVPDPQPDHADRLVAMAMAMIRGVRSLNREGDLPNECPALQIRIGIASGPMVAGIVGTVRFLYDVWGDTVNVASRMESSGIAGRCQVAESTVTACRNSKFTFLRRGEIEIKGKGMMETFVVDDQSIEME